MDYIDDIDHSLEIEIKHDDQIMFTCATEFSRYIEQTAYDNDVTCLACLMDFLTQKDIEPEMIKNLVSDSLKNKLKQDFIDKGMLKKSNSLDMIDNLFC